MKTCRRCGETYYTPASGARGRTCRDCRAERLENHIPDLVDSFSRDPSERMREGFGEMSQHRRRWV